MQPDRREFLGAVAAVVGAIAPGSVFEAYLNASLPELPMLVSEWADKYRVLPNKGSSEPGPWRTSRTPYLREIMDCMSTTSMVREVVVMKAAQIGFSEALANVLGYIVDHAPGPTMLVQPTVELAKRFSRQRIEPLFADTPRLAGKVAEERSRDHRSSMLSKDFRGGVLIITGANSAVGLRSMPARYLLPDEVDAYPIDVDGEGSPVELAEARQRNFPRRKTFKGSTPTIAGLSRIEDAYLATDMRRYYVPCPQCGGFQTLDFERLQWTKFELPPSEAVYECLYCEAQIQNYQKTRMLARGEWRATADDPTDPKVRGYHISALYCPVGWMSWGEIATMFVKVHKNPTKYRVFVNTVLGQTWVEKGEAPEWERLYQRREDYAEGTVPAAALMLTAGVDVQKDRLVVEVVAWGAGKESWSVMYGEIPGDTADSERGPWKDLDAMLGRTFTCEDGRELPISKLAVDSGYNTMTVYSWCRTHSMSQVIAVKGVPGIGALIGVPSSVEINARGKKPVYGYKVWPVHGAVAKGELYGFLKLDPPLDGEACPPGYCHFPMYEDDYFKQLTAEHLVSRKTRGGFLKLEWEMIPGRENHVLDARVYARAAASLAGMDRWKAPAAQVAQTPKPKPERKGWLTRGRDEA